MYQDLLKMLGLLILLVIVLYMIRRKNRRLAEGWKIVESESWLAKNLQESSGLIIGAFLGAIAVSDYNIPAEYFGTAFVLWILIPRTKWLEPNAIG